MKDPIRFQTTLIDFLSPQCFGDNSDYTHNGGHNQISTPSVCARPGKRVKKLKTLCRHWKYASYPHRPPRGCLSCRRLRRGTVDSMEIMKKVPSKQYKRSRHSGGSNLDDFFKDRVHLTKIPRSDVIIKHELVRMWSQCDLLHFIRHLVPDPQAHEVFREHVTPKEELMITLEGFERLLK